METTAATESSSSRRHKKSSKHKKPRVSQQPVPEDETSGDLLIVDDLSTSFSTPIIKTTKSPIGGSKPSTSAAAGTAAGNVPNKKRKKRDSASSDEERWLTAIESGKLEDVDDELKKIKPKDPSLMTARQRAMYDRGGADGPSPATPTLMSLPTGYKEKVMTAEAIQKAAIKSQKRKQLADEKREKDKKKTMDRLLKKQDSKAAKAAKNKIAKMNVPMISYRQNINLTTISFPDGMDWPLKVGCIEEAPKPRLCDMGCGNLKKYSCSRTNKALCSLECYQKNLAIPS